MAHLAASLVVVLAVAAAGASPSFLKPVNWVPHPAKPTGISAEVEFVSRMGAALQPTVAKQWESVLAYRRQHDPAFHKQVLANAHGPAAPAVASLIAKMGQLGEVRKAKLRSWIEQQKKDTTTLVAKYLDLLQKSQPSAGRKIEAPAEKAIRNLRKEHETLAAKWEGDLISLTVDTRTATFKLVKQAVQAAKDPAVKQAVRAAGKDLLWNLIDGQGRTISVLTTTISPELSTFTGKAGTLLTKISVSVQTDSL